MRLASPEISVRVGGYSEGRSEINSVKKDSSDLSQWNRYQQDQRRISRYSLSYAVLLINMI